MQNIPLQERLSNIKEKIFLLKKRDKKYKVFCSDEKNGHGYKLYPVLAEEEISAYEKKYCIQLPEEYREFLKQIGNGGVGPGYGIYPIQKAFREDHSMEDRQDFSVPFSYSTIEANALIQEYLQSNEEVLPLCSPQDLSGYIILSTDGCGREKHLLIVKGEEYGRIWHGGISIFPFYSVRENQVFRPGFLDWYEDWLDRSLHFYYEIPSEVLDVKALDLRDDKLEILPPLLFQCRNLETLLLDNNKLEKIPEDIGKLKYLKSLSINSNLKLEKLPQNLVHLSDLNSLSLRGCNLKELPEKFDHLLRLESLNLAGNRLMFLPDTIGHLASLKTFIISYNSLDSLPESLGKCSQLRNLMGSKNKFKTLPSSFFELRQLQTLDLSGNALEGLPLPFSNLQHLQVLDVSKNPFKKFPGVLKQLKNLKELWMSDCPITDIREMFLALADLPYLHTLHVSVDTLPPEVGLLKKLRRCYFYPRQQSQNQELQIPTEMGNLSKLEILSLCGFGISELPDSFGNLKQLYRLELSNNHIRSFPSSIKNLQKLRCLYLGMNPILIREKEKLKVMLPKTWIDFEM